MKFYKEDEQINYTDFKDKLWNKIIIKSKPAREQCFLKMALQRATDGQFFINPDCESEILDNELKKDGILGYESPHGYFITHDIYEEWALEKILRLNWEKTDNKTFSKIWAVLCLCAVLSESGYRKSCCYKIMKSKLLSNKLLRIKI